MPRVTQFNSPLLVGFDHFERLLNQVQKSSGEGYPPYNIEQIGENGLLITLAVAGFTMDDLSVSVEDGQLVVRGKTAEDSAERIFIHRGIASRQFQKSFVLAEGIEVKGATLDNGLLNIALSRIIQEPEIKTIAITKGPGAKASRQKTIDVDDGE